MKTNSSQLPGALQPTCRAHIHELFNGDQIPIVAQRETIDSDSGSTASAGKKILVPLALSGGSGDTLAVAAQLARKSRAQLVFFHAVQLNIAGEERGIDRTRLLSELCQTADLKLKQLAALIDDNVSTEVVVSDGRPAEAIVQAAKRIAADAIVMSARPHHRWLKWLHRNTAPNVIRQAPCAVILISADKKERERKHMQSRRVRKTPVNIVNHENTNLHQSVLRVLFS